MNLEGVKVLVVDDEMAICKVLADSLRDEGCVVKVAHSGEEALKVSNEFKPTILLLDIWMPGDIDGLEALEELKKRNDCPWVIVMSGHGTIETAVKAVKLGAWDFVEKPLSMEKVFILMKNILAFSNQEKEKETLLNRLRESVVVVGESPHIQHIKSLIHKFGSTSSSFLIKGEDGVGKALVARNIHYVSKRASRPFIMVNCGALPEGLHVNELWGGEALHPGGLARSGMFEMANGGTLFFKNIELLDSSAQDKLVAFLREKESFRSYDIRVVASSTKDLVDLVKEKKFREDLYIKLSTLSIELKPLKERKMDIVLLVEHFSQDYCRKAGLPLRAFTSDALKLLESHDWDGNILELKNFVERVHILSPSEEFDSYDVRYAGLIVGDQDQFSGYGTFREARAQFEKDYLLAKISEFNGNISKTSEAIGLERSYLHRKIKAYGIDVDNSR